MIRRSPLVCGLLSVALVCGGVSVGLLPGLGSAAVSAVPGVWQSPEDVPGIATLNVGHFAQMSVVALNAGGTVTITAGRVRVCLVALKDATSSCRLKARPLHAGSYEVLAAYGGNPHFKGIGLTQLDPQRHPLSAPSPTR